ncbi:MAG: signal peptidase I [Acidimicrobiales bacterium]
MSSLILGALVGLTLTANVPRLAGWQPTVIQGESMTPTIDRGDVVIARPEPDGPRGAGQIVLFRDPNRVGRTTLHRIQSNVDGWIVTKGDHNRDADTTRIRSRDVVGLAVLRIPKIGWPLVWFSTGNWPPLVASVGVLLLAVWMAGRVVDRDSIPYRTVIDLLDAA